MRPSSFTFALTTAAVALGVSSYNTAPHGAFGRRQAFGSIAATFGAAVVGTASANALDMDAFVNSQIESDTKNCDPKRDPKCIPKLSQDEALCKYGQSGEARGEACKRVKKAGGELPSTKAQGKSLGGAYAM